MHPCTLPSKVLINLLNVDMGINRIHGVTRPGAKTINKNKNSTENKSQTQRARAYEVTSFLSTDCELSTETCSKNVIVPGGVLDEVVLCL